MLIGTVSLEGLYVIYLLETIDMDRWYHFTLPLTKLVSITFLPIFST